MTNSSVLQSFLSSRKEESLGVTRFEGGIVGTKAHGIQEMVSLLGRNIFIGTYQQMREFHRFIMATGISHKAINLKKILPGWRDCFDIQ